MSKKVDITLTGLDDVIEGGVQWHYFKNGILL